MPRSFLQVHNVSFSYHSSTSPVINHLTCQFETGWTGIIGANGCGKTTLLRLLTGELQPSVGVLNLPAALVYCEQRTDHMPSGFRSFFVDYNPLALRLKSQLDIHEEWIGRWHTLSHGERKRVQIGVALAQEPDILAIDEPSNHLDSEAKAFLLRTLKSYKGVGLLVSHDREVLDNLCTHILYINPPECVLRKGNYSTTIADVEKERANQAHLAEQGRRRMKKLQCEIHNRARKAAEADAKKSKRGISRKDHDAKSKKDLAKLIGKDAVEGKALNRLKSQMHRLHQNQDQIGWKKPPPSGIRIQQAERLAGTFLFHIRAGQISMGTQVLEFPDLYIKPEERVGLTGPNGAGKSTLIGWLLDRMEINPERLIVIPQETDASGAEKILSRIKNLSGDQIGLLMAIISRLGSDPARLLETELPSPGELRKLMLAEGIRRNPQFIIMDEPTNHMDLPSIRHVEEALDGCNCAMILASHDKPFLDRLIHTRWIIKKSESGINQLKTV